MKKTILITEDDEDIVELLTLYLTGNEFDVLVANDGLHAYHIIKDKTVDLLLLDIMIPKMNGYELIKKLREEHNSIPIIILSAKSMDIDKILGLNLGADSYITKPFNPLEVVATIHALFRRCMIMQSSEKMINLGDLSLDLEEFILRKKGEVIPLTSTEIKLLAKMMKNPNHLFSKSQLYEVITSDLYEKDENTVIVHISNIRSKIEDNLAKPKYIKTVRGLGYKFVYEKK